MQKTQHNIFLSEFDGTQTKMSLYIHQFQEIFSKLRPFILEFPFFAKNVIYINAYSLYRNAVKEWRNVPKNT